MKKPHKETVIACVLFVLAVAAAAGLAYAITLVVAPINVTFDGDAFTLKCLYHSETIAFDEIESVTLSDDYRSKTKKGYGGQAKEFGVYKNEELGSHYRLTYTENQNNYIICLKKDGSATVFNQKTKTKTEELYEKILSKITPQAQQEND